ncbi:tetratricopeptide repeat protein [Parabacteroides timonensis]|uniref:tetratricopeptide repeat protein n=1 Tax=Parabacteroides timonensis TaxID=1871013 RepID=UPI00094E5CC0|nr:tetratricopeptide repeat protein [Parabacteroides timonensis]
MKKDDISRLLQRYLDAHEKGKEPYFDADELSDLLDSFEESDDYKYFDEILALGLKLHPGNIDLQIRQCRFYVYNEDYESALALIDTIAETDSQDLDLLRLECFCMLDQYDKVVEYTEDIAARDCDYLELAFEYIAPLLSDMEMNKEARDYIKRGITLFPDNLNLKDELCYSLEMEGDIDGAITICNELIDKDPYSHDYWFSLGRLYSIKAEFDKAIEAFDFALTCDDSDPELKILKAYCLYMNENYEKALEVYKEIETDSDMTERIKPLMAECYIKLEDYEGAYRMLKDIIGKKIVTNEPAAYINYIRCCTETNRDREASNTLIKAVELFPNNVRILSLLALTYVENGEDRLAIDTTERLFNVLDQGSDYLPEDYESLFHAGQFLYMKGEIEKALKYYLKVLEVNPDMPYIHLHLAMAYLAKGDMKHFGEHFSQTSPQELVEYLESSGVDFSDVEQQLMGKHIPPEDLTKEFLNNKDNNN